MGRGNQSSSQRIPLWHVLQVRSHSKLHSRRGRCGRVEVVVFAVVKRFVLQVGLRRDKEGGVKGAEVEVDVKNRVMRIVVVAVVVVIVTIVVVVV